MPFSYEIKIANSGRARRRLNPKSLDEKALGSNLGQLARGAAVFDPNAYDGDGDGLVQDSTPFERPAVLSAIASLSRGGFSSEGAWGDTFDNWTVGKTNEEIAEIAVPDNEVQLIQYVQALIGAYGKRSFDNEAEVIEVLLKGKNFDFTPETITSLREQLAQALNDNPELRKYIDNFGIPPVVTRDLDWGNARMTTHLLLTLDKDYVMSRRPPRSEEGEIKQIASWKDELEDRLGTPRAWDFVVPEGTSIPPLVGSSVLSDTFIHEYGHFLHAVAIDNHPDPAMRDELWNLWTQRWHEIAEKKGIRDGIFTVATNIVDSRSPENPLPSDYGMVPPSAYAITEPAEFVAEVFLKTIRHRDEATNDEKKLIADITGFASRSLTPNDESKYGLTPYEIAQIVVPGSPEEAIETLEDWTQSFLDLREYPDLVASGETASERVKKELKRMKKYLSIYRVQSRPASKPNVTPDEIFDFSPETVAKMREIVEQTLIQQPQMLEHVRLFGMPPIFVTKEPMDEMSAFFQTGAGPDYIVFHPSVILDENWFKAPRAFDESYKIKGTEWYFTANGKNGATATLTHEYGHYINNLSADIHPDRESRYLAGWYWRQSWEEVAPRGLKGFKYRMAVKKFKKANPDFVSDTADKRWLQSYELQRAIKRSESLDWENGPPHVLSEYGQTNPTEMFAEGYQGLVSGDAEMAARVSPTLRRDIEMIVGRVPRDNITNVREVDTEQRTPKQGFASLSITREPDGTRSMAEAMNGGDDSPLDGSDWLKDATPREIAQALVPRTKQDAVRLIIQSLLTGNRTPDPLSLAAIVQIVEEAFDHDLFDYSPDAIAKMEEYLEKTLIESPQFLWQVRRFGSLPFLATDRKKVKRYRDHAKRGIKTRVPKSSGPRLDYPFTQQLPPEHLFLAQLFDVIVDSPSVMGVTFGGMFIAMNMSHRNWPGLWDRSEKMPSHGGFSRRSLLGKLKDPNEISIFPENDSLGRTMLANFTVSFEGTMVHEWHHGWWSRLFGHKPDVSALLPTQTQPLNVTKDAMVRIGGGRAARLKYFFPNLTYAEADAITTFARDNFSQQSLTQVPAGGSPHSAQNTIFRWMHMASTTYDQLRPNSTVASRDIFLQRLEDYYNDIAQIGLKRLQKEAARQSLLTGKLTTDNDVVMAIGANPNDPKEAASAVLYYGYDPVFTDTWWKAMATDYPDIFGDPRLSLTTLAGQYAQKNPQETLAELGAMLAQPDKNYADTFVTPELRALFLYLMGEHGDPFTPTNAPGPWSQQRGFPSRTERVIHARETVSQRASNSLGNVASMSTPSGEASRRITSTMDSNGHTNFRVGNYAFTIPGDKYMPDLSTAYTRWASESHFDMQQISAMIMGLKPSDSRPAYQVGNTEINALISGLPIETEEYKEMRKNIRSMVAETQRMLNELRDTETHSSMPLYHTLAAMNSSDGLINANVGDEIYLPLASFTPRVVGPSDVPVYLRTFNPNESSAVLKLAIGARVINSNLLENVNHNDEWLDVPIENITGGRFRVASRKERNGIPFIEIEHSDIFDTNQGKFSNVDPEKAMSSIKDMVLIDRGIREVEGIYKDRSSIDKDDPRYGVLTDQLNSRTDEVVLSMFGNNIQPPNPIGKLSPDKQQRIIDEIPVLRAIPISSMDKRNLPGFTSTSSNFGFDRIITPERNLARASVRMLEENREYIKERQMVGTNDRVLDDSWITGTIERMDSGEITHVDAMDTMGIAVEVLRNRVRNQVSTEDATNGDIYNYQKIGNRLRQAMLVEINNEDIDSASLPNRPMGFASETSRTNTKISEPFNPTVISTQASDDEWKEFESERTIVQAVVYDIKGEKVVFGVQERHGLDTTGIKVIALNPYEITGLDRDSEKGQEMALDWLYANLASSAETDYRNDNRTEISALLYAATKGDKEAGKKFKEYAATGRAMAAEKRQEALDKERQSLEARLSDPRVSSDVKSLQQRLAISRRTKKDGSYVSNVSEKEIEDAKITPNNLVLVRWSEFPPEYDTDGNVILYPAGNYVATDRNTVHFTLNHSVEEHMFWDDGTGEGYIIMVTLGDVLDANGIESLDNLYGVDTYFTPKPGEGFKIPKPKVIKVSKGENRKAITDRVIGEEFDAFAVQGGPHYTNTAGFEDTVRLVARDLGIVPGGLHANRPHSMLEQINNYIGSDGETRDLLPEKNNTGVHSEDIGEMERNAILRLSDREHAPWSGVSRSSVPNPAGSFASSSQGSSRRMSTGLTNPKQIKVVDSIQQRIGFASRTDAVDPRGKDLEEVAKELELTELEKRELAKLLPDFENIEEYKFHPSITPEQRRKIIDSVRVRIDNGVPYLTIDGHPFLVDEIPDKRDWSTVVAPSEEEIQPIRDLLQRLGEKIGVARFDRPNNMGMTLEEVDRAIEHTALNIVAFSQWAMELYRSIGVKYPVFDDSDVDRSNMPDIPGGMFWNTGMGLYFNAISGLLQGGILDYFGEDDFLNTHDLWGHIATGRSFDRHGEWANALAIWSLMDRWAEENDISESDLLRAKLKWITDLEFSRFSFRRFTNEPDTDDDIDKAFQRAAMNRVMEGIASDEEIKELLALIDHGRVAESVNAKNLVDATQEERAEIVKTDIVRQTLRERLGFASRSASVVGKDSEQIAKELELSDEELIILSEDSLLDNIEQITNGELEKRPIHSKIEKLKKRLFDSIRVEMSDDGIPMIMADPNPLIFQFVPDKRDWSKVRVPKRETVVKTAEYIKQHQDENWPIESYKTIQEFGDRLLALVRGESEGTPQEDIGDSVGTGWLSLYLSGLSDPIVTSYFGTNRVGDSIHDLFGHAGIGRGFDRHGEWANPLALISTLDHPIFDDFTEADKDGIKRFLMIEYAVTRIEQTYGYQTLSGKRQVYDETTDSSQWSTWIQFFDGDIQTIIDMLDDSDRTQILNDDGSPKKARSSGFASISAATRSDIREIAKQDAIHAKGFASKASIQESSRVIGEGGDASKASILDRAKKILRLNDRQVSHIDAMTQHMHKIFSNGDIYDEPIHPEIDEKRKELLDSIRVVKAEGGMTMIVAEPNPVINAYLPVKRDWASVELPSIEIIERAVEKIKSNLWKPKKFGDTPFQGPGTGMAKFEAHLERLRNEVFQLADGPDKMPYESASSAREMTSLQSKGDYISWVQQYYDSLRNPRNAWSLLPGTDGMHDAFGHFGTGRGYDRHGEWANFLALKDMIENTPGMTDAETEEVLRWWFREYGIQNIIKIPNLPEGIGELLFSAVSPMEGYDGNFKDILDILESGHSGLDDAPTKAFASKTISKISVPELQLAAKNDVESRLSRQPSGFASRRRDWKTNTHDIEIDTSSADSDMFNVDENGNTIQIHVPDKAKVLNPKTKQYMILDSVPRASEYIADGGNLSEVPDDYIMEAMLMNIDRLPGTKFVKQNGRFKFTGMGGGQYGALRLVDSKTGTIFGIKFDSDFKYGVLGVRAREATEIPSLTPSDKRRLGMTETVGPKRLMPQERIIPVNNGTDNLSYHQSMNEIIAGAISEMLGFEPMPMRIVKRSRQGSGDGFYDGDENKDGVRRPGIALILEFAQSRYTDVEEYDNQVPTDTIKPISMLRLILLDTILANWDRNDGNILMARQSDGSRAIVPLDNGDSIQESGFLTTNPDGTRVRSFSHGGASLTRRGAEYGLRHAMDYHLPLNYTGKSDSLKQATLEEIQTMVSSIMVDYRTELKEKTEQIEKITANAIEHLEKLGLSKERIDMLKEDYKEALINVRRRWEELSQMSDEELSEIIYENILARS